MSELEKNLEYIAAHCDGAVEITKWTEGYQIEGYLKGEQVDGWGDTIKIAAFEMMDAIRNELSD